MAVWDGATEPHFRRVVAFSEPSMAVWDGATEQPLPHPDVAEEPSMAMWDGATEPTHRGEAPGSRA